MWWLRRSSRLIFVAAFGRYKSKTAGRLPPNPYTNTNTSCSNSKRFYYVDRNQVERYFKPRGCKQWIRNPKNLRKLGLFGLLGSAVLIPVYLCNLESVPYARGGERSRLMLYSTRLEKKLGESWAESIKKDLFPGRVVPSHHPDSIRVGRIMQNIVEAAWKTRKTKEKETGTETATWFHKMINNVGKPSPNLEEFKWEVFLVNEPSVNAFNLFGGKVFVYTGLLDICKTDAEIATVIAHEVGHGIARHCAEKCSNNPWLAMSVFISGLIPEDKPWLFTIFESIVDQIYQYFLPDDLLFHILSSLFVTLPYSRRMEMEADYIGLVLMASAGYDPPVAPKVYEKLGETEGGRTSTDDFFDVIEDYISTHPCGKTRANLLSQPQVMDEALSLYKEAQPQPTSILSFLCFWKS